MGRGSCRIAVDSCVSTCLGRALDNQHSQQPAVDGTGVKGFDFRTVEPHSRNIAISEES